MSDTKIHDPQARALIEQADAIIAVLKQDVAAVQVDNRDAREKAVKHLAVLAEQANNPNLIPWKAGQGKAG